MKSNRILGAVAIVGGIALLGVIAFPLVAGETERPMAKTAKMSGVVYDLHCVMSGHDPSADRVKCTTDCLRAGVPAVLQTPDGIVLLGKGMAGCGELLAPLACKDVEVYGKLYESHGVRYFDIQEIKVAAHLESTLEREDDDDDGDD